MRVRITPKRPFRNLRRRLKGNGRPDMTWKLMMIGAVAAFLAACAGGRPKTSHQSLQTRLGPGWQEFHGSISHGLYAPSEPGADDINLVLSPAHGFILRSSQGGCALVERRGTWSSDSGMLKLGVRDVRHRMACAEPWQLRKSDSLIEGFLYMSGGSIVPVLAWEGGRSPLPMARARRPELPEATARILGPANPGVDKRKRITAKATGRKTPNGYLSTAKNTRAAVPAKTEARKPGAESGS